MPITHVELVLSRVTRRKAEITIPGETKERLFVSFLLMIPNKESHLQLEMPVKLPKGLLWLEKSLVLKTDSELLM